MGQPGAPEDPFSVRGIEFLARRSRPGTAAGDDVHGRTSPRATASSAASAFVDTSIFS